VVVDDVGERLKRMRVQRGMSLSELARRSGVGKGTVSELENGLRSARLETLFALSTALEAPLGDLLPAPGASGAAPLHGEAVTAILMDRWSADALLLEAYRARVDTTTQHSVGHAAGVSETITVIQGRVRVGCLDALVELSAGQSHHYAGDRPHRFEALLGPAEVLLLMQYPAPATTPDP